MNEFKDQLDAAEKDKVSKLVEELRELAVKGQAADPSVDAEKIKEKIGETQQASLGLFQKVSVSLSNPVQYVQWWYYRYMRSATRRTVPKRSLRQRSLLRHHPRRRRIKQVLDSCLQYRFEHILLCTATNISAFAFFRCLTLSHHSKSNPACRMAAMSIIGCLLLKLPAQSYSFRSFIMRVHSYGLRQCIDAN